MIFLHTEGPSPYPFWEAGPISLLYLIAVIFFVICTVQSFRNSKSQPATLLLFPILFTLFAITHWIMQWREIYLTALKVNAHDPFYLMVIGADMSWFCLLCCGTALISLLTAGFSLLRSGKSCLLYTSPSPRDRTRSRMPSSA